MSNIDTVHTVLLSDEEDVSPDTPLYKYMSTEAFLYFFQFGRLIISRISDWPDSYEGTRFEFLKRTNHAELGSVSRDDFYATCWTLQIEEDALYSSNEEFRAAQRELAEHGSAAMWDSYCKNGGVRIKTTLEKLERILSKELPDWKIYRGKVFYEPSDWWIKTATAPHIVSGLFHKRVSFRSESEYRFVCLSESGTGESKVSVCVGDLYDFLDEILISPAVATNKWLSRTLYNLAIGISIAPPERTSINRKNGEQFCRISQLYQLVDESVGHVSMT